MTKGNILYRYLCVLHNQPQYHAMIGQVVSLLSYFNTCQWVPFVTMATFLLLFRFGLNCYSVGFFLPQKKKSNNGKCSKTPVFVYRKKKTWTFVGVPGADINAIVDRQHTSYKIYAASNFLFLGCLHPKLKKLTLRVDLGGQMLGLLSVFFFFFNI